MLDYAKLEAALREAGWYLPFKLYDEVDSTNVEAKRLIREDGFEEGGLIAADKQTAGKGRLGRSWFASPGKDLTFTLAFKNTLNRVDIPKTGLAAALGICDALEKQHGIETRLKWPNDILIGGHKIAGILSEYVTPEEFIIVGVGLNVNSTKSDWKFTTVTPPTSIKTATGREYERESLMASCAVGVRDFLSFARWEYFPTFKTLYETRAFLDNMRVVVYLDAYGDREADKDVDIREAHRLVIEGTALAIDRYGALIVRDDDGFDHTVRAGDMVLAGG